MIINKLKHRTVLGKRRYIQEFGVNFYARTCLLILFGVTTFGSPGSPSFASEVSEASIASEVSVTSAVVDKNYIVGGQQVNDVAKYPFIASVQVDNSSSTWFSHACGGSLIADRWVLTAAHCLYNSDFDTFLPSSQVGVRLGDTDLAQRDGFFLASKQIVVHPDYNPNNFDNDIALIELATAYPASVARLATKNSSVTEPGQIGSVIGWGSVVESGFQSSKLREVDLPLVSNVACYSYYRDSFDSRYSLCAGGSIVGGKDACQGDSGGPLLVLHEGVYIVVGLVSYGDGCGRSGTPGVYTRVDAFTDWIVSHANDAIEFEEQIDVSLTNSSVITHVDVNTVINDEIDEQEVHIYDVTGAKQVNLFSISGDADLYIVDSPDAESIAAATLLCSSENITSFDYCVLRNKNAKAYAAVYAFSDASYTLSSQLVQSSAEEVVLLSLDDQSAIQSNDSDQQTGLGAAFHLVFLLMLVLTKRGLLRLSFSREKSLRQVW